MLMSEEQWRARKVVAEAAKKGRVRCRKCGKRLLALEYICKCGGRSAIVPMGCACVEQEDLSTLGRCYICGYVGDADLDPCPECAAHGDRWLMWPFLGVYTWDEQVETPEGFVSVQDGLPCRVRVPFEVAT